MKEDATDKSPNKIVVKTAATESPGRMVQIPNDISHIVFALFGFQSRKPGAVTPAREALQRLCAEEYGPDQIERAHFVDPDGYESDVLMAYWIGRENFLKWNTSQRVVTWWKELSLDPASDLGVWRELMSPPRERFQHSSFIDKRAAIALLFPLVRSPHFGYTGSGRDRYEASKYDDFDTPYAEVPDAVIRETRGKRIRITSPDNLYFTREGQRWDGATEDDRVKWHTEVDPAIGQWIRTLQTEPKETGSLSLRPCREQDVNTGEEIERQSQFGFVLSRRYIEHAARTHPSHLSLLKSWFSFSNDVAIRSEASGIGSFVHIWVEGHILKSGELDAQYVNCHPRTGLLPYFDASEVGSDSKLMFDLEHTMI